MIYVQVSEGQKLHLAYEPGEGKNNSNIISAGFLSLPLCGMSAPSGYQITSNSCQLAYVCKRCLKVYNARQLAAIR